MIRNYGLRIRESIGVKDTQINLNRPEIGYCLIIDYIVSRMVRASLII